MLALKRSAKILLLHYLTKRQTKEYAYIVTHHASWTSRWIAARQNHWNRLAAIIKSQIRLNVLRCESDDILCYRHSFIILAAKV